MSRIGKKPIAIPDGVDVSIKENQVTVKGPKGTLTRSFQENIAIKLEENQVVVERANDLRQNRALHGTTRSLIANMIEGVSQGFSKILELVGVGYRAQKKGNTLELAVGYSHPVVITPPKGVEIEVPSQTQIVVKGIDKEEVGALAAKIRSVREPEPYNGKGIKYKDEIIRRKEGKSGK